MRVVLTIGLALLVAGLAPTPARSSPPLPHRNGRGASHYAAGRFGKKYSIRKAAPVTTYPQMVAELHEDVRRSPWVRLAVVGESHQGRGIWLVRVASPGGPPPARATRIFVLCRQHGDEPAPTEAVLRLLGRIADRAYTPPSGVTLYFVPMVNPDGAALGVRENGDGADLNRDWGVFSQPETRAVARAVGAVHPQIIVDEHNWDVGDPFNANCLEVSRQTDSFLARAAQAMQAETVGALQDAGYSVAATTYGPDADPRLAHRWFTHQGYVSCLVETHSGSPTDTLDFRRRQGVYVTLIQTLARRYAGDHAALDALEGISPTTTREVSLFPPPPTPILGGPKMTARRQPALWPWAVLPYGLLLFVAYISRGGGSGTARTRVPAPATLRQSAGHPGKLRYQCSPCSPDARPALVGYGRKR